MNDKTLERPAQSVPTPPASKRDASGLYEVGPDPIEQTTSLGDLIAASADAVVHILFVHGIRAADRGVSKVFQQNLLRRLPQVVGAGAQPGPIAHTEPLDVGPWPHVTFMGAEVWPTAEAWRMGPFVDRYEYRRADGRGELVVDEINWWPLALPLRCIALLQPEAYLAGPDVADLNICAALDPHGADLNDDIHYPFLSRGDLEMLKQAKVRGSGAARINGSIKRGLMDWGLSDAVIALGPMQKYLHAAINGAFQFAADRKARQVQPTKFVVVSESLGSFIMIDAYSNHLSAVQAVLDDTAYLYFFANQFALLELGRLTDPLHPAPLAATVGSASLAVDSGGRLSLHKALQRWAARDPITQPAAAPLYKQIISFSDPSDALTFRVPPLDGVTVVNVYDRNGLDVFGVLADPVRAHTGHSANPHVLDLMLSQRAPKAGSAPV